MKNLGMFILASVMFFSCETKQEEKQQETSTVQSATVDTDSKTLDLGCYGFNDGKSVVMLDVTDNKKEVKGNLSYALVEKDKNVGTFTGNIQNNILLATYTFQSEGMTSTRTVAYRIDGNKLIEGYGEMNVDGVSFVNVDSITYNSSMPLEKGKCNK